MKRLMTAFCCVLVVGCSTLDVQNNYRLPNKTAKTALMGAGSGALVGAWWPNAGPGLMIAGVGTGAALGGYFASHDGLRRELYYFGVRIVRMGDRYRLLLPVDSLFEIGTAELREDRLSLLIEVATLLQRYPKATIHVAGFGDDVGSDEWNEALSHQQAQSLLGFFWSHGISPQRMTEAGHGKRFDIADNASVLGSALNRRIEIVWDAKPIPIQADNANKSPEFK